MSPGPVYRVVDGEMADDIALALDTGKRYINMAPANEGPGHLTCMLYSAVVCPYLSSPGARRQMTTTTGGERIPRGDRRGTEAAIVGFENYKWQVGTHGIEISFGQPTEILSYADGADLMEELAAEIAHESDSAERCPDYLLDDDAKVEKAAKSFIKAASGSPPATTRREDQLRKNRRKAAKAARRKSR